MKKLTVIIVDNQPIFRQGLRQVLSSYDYIEVVGECDLTDNVCTIIDSLSPDVALVEVASSSLNGFGVAQQIAKHCPRVAVVTLSSNPDDNQLFQAIRSGSVAFLGKDIPPDQLADVLSRIGQGECPINSSLLDKPNTAMQVMDLFRHMAVKNRPSFLTPLSPRELEILGYVANGNPNKYIAVILHVSEQTIKNHLTSILRKLNANDRTQAVVLATRNGWLNLDALSGKQAKEELCAELV